MSLRTLQAEGQGWSFWGCWRPRRGEEAGGDFCWVRAAEGGVLAVVADVLGHGEEAHASAREMQETLERQKGSSPEAYFGAAESVAARRRGCALFVGFFAPLVLRYIMVGNMRGWLVKNPCKVDLLFPQPGVVGGRKVTPAVREVNLAGAEGVIVCSDGIRRGFVPALHHGLPERWGMGLALHILEKFGLPEDDASVLVGKRWR